MPRGIPGEYPILAPQLVPKNLPHRTIQPGTSERPARSVLTQMLGGPHHLSDTRRHQKKRGACCITGKKHAIHLQPETLCELLCRAREVEGISKARNGAQENEGTYSPAAFPTKTVHAGGRLATPERSTRYPLEAGTKPLGRRERRARFVLTLIPTELTTSETPRLAPRGNARNVLLQGGVGNSTGREIHAVVYLGRVGTKSTNILRPRKDCSPACLSDV